MPVTISHTTRKRPPEIPYQEITEKIAGKRYTLSIVFIGTKRAQALNIAHRGKEYVPNVLSFPLDEHTGEIFICPLVAKKQAKGFGLSYTGYIAFLLIHGLLHLKGYDHGDTMDTLERKYMRAFSIT